MEAIERPPAPAHRAADQGRSAATGAYARVWRWHFYAALLVIPFVLWQAVTGTLYLWHRELAIAAHPELLRVEPRAQRTSLEQQLQAALADDPGAQLTYIEIDDDPGASVIHYFTTPQGLLQPKFTDPYSGVLLGTVEPARWLGGLSRSLHGGWPLGDRGSNLLELGASWAIVMILTGLYLWWPRDARGLAGALYPRLRSRPRVFWRDIHCTVGVWFSLIVLAFLVTALPWTAFWGGEVLGRVQRATHQFSPTAAFFGTGGHGPAHAARHAVSAHAHHAADHRGPLDVFVATARREGLSGPLEIRLGAAGDPVAIRTRTGRAPYDVYLQLDRHGGALLQRSDWRDTTLIPRIVAIGVDLHEGHFFGRANQWFNTLVAGSLVWLSVTGFVGWYRRRPGRAGLSAPPRQSMPAPRVAWIIGGLLCALLPLFGASVLFVALADRAIRRVRPARSPL